MEIRSSAITSVHDPVKKKEKKKKGKLLVQEEEEEPRKLKPEEKFPQLLIVQGNQNDSLQLKTLIEQKQQQDSDGLYVLERGKCVVVNPYDAQLKKNNSSNLGYQKYDPYAENNGVLSRGEFFGEALSLNTISLNFFGEILAQDEEVELLFISKENLQRIAGFEKQKMKAVAEKRIQGWLYRMGRKYQVNTDQFVLK